MFKFETTCIYMVSTKLGTKHSYTTEEPKLHVFILYHKSHLQNTKHRVGFVSAHRGRAEKGNRVLQEMVDFLIRIGKYGLLCTCSEYRSLILQESSNQQSLKKI